VKVREGDDALDKIEKSNIRVFYKDRQISLYELIRGFVVREGSPRPELGGVNHPPPNGFHLAYIRRICNSILSFRKFISNKFAFLPFGGSWFPFRLSDWFP